MKIYVNGEEKSVNTDITITNLLVALAIDTAKGMAIAVNQKVVPATIWPDTTLAEDDQILLIRATKGG